jgi:DNA-binding beta-propeller fold protein YncE
MSARRLTLVWLVALCVSIGTMLLWGASAFAERGHVFDGMFGEPCAEEPCGKGQFKEPGEVAVDESTGDVYAIDRGDDRVEWFSSSGAYLGQFDGSGSFEVGGKAETGLSAGTGGQSGEIPTGRFTRPTSIAIDNACALHSPALTEATTPTCHEFDSSAGDVYLLDAGGGRIGGHEVIDKFSATGEYLGQLTGTLREPLNGPVAGVSVDSSGSVWVAYYQRDDIADCEPYEDCTEIYRFSNTNPNAFMAERAVLGEGGNSQGFAVDFNRSFYYFYFFGGSVSFENAPAVRYTSAGEGIELRDGKSSLESHQIGPFVPPLIETIVRNGEGSVYGLAVDPVTQDVYVSQEDSVTRFSEKLSQVEQLGSGHISGGGASGIGIDASSEEVYVADSVADVIDMFPSEPPSKPRIAAQAVVSVTSGSATFSASIDPEGFPTEYHFEYGPTVSYGESLPLPDATIGSGFELHETISHVQDLEAGTVYHYRLVARNSDGTTYGEDQTFTTQVSGSALGLPDGRVYEMVTPPPKEGALILGPNWAHLSSGSEALTGQAAADGSAIMDLASRPTEAGPLGNAMEVAVLSTRGSSGWSSQVIAPPHEKATFISISNGGEYRFLSEDLSQAIVQPFGPFIQLAPSATESTSYLHTNFAPGDPTVRCQSSCFQPLVTASNTPAGTVFGEALPSGACPREFCGPDFLDATPDLSHVIVSSPAQLTSASAPEGGLYEWTGGRLQLISAPPEGQTGILRLAGSETINTIPTTHAAPGERDARHAISNNGERVILAGNGGLYLRDLTTGKLIRLDAPQGGAATSKSPSYMTASTDASRIFFLDNAGLTSESSAVGTDLYEYDVDAPVGHRLTDLTVDRHGEEAANVEAVIGASNDGSYVYFLAAGALASGASPGDCIPYSGNPLPENREDCNIYVRHDDVTQLVAGDWNALPSGEGAEGSGAARVSPDGHWLAFMSSRNLTGYDTHDSMNGHPDQEVYLYDADADKLVCPSCNPTGARPVGIETTAFNLAGGSLPDHTWTASNVPPLTIMEAASLGGGSRHQPRYLSDAGRLFFDSNDALVPQDVNGTEDVYEYEPPGIGSCTASSVTFAVRSGGCVSLISSGSSAEESAFVDASETGGDAFFVTYSKLLPQDFDNAPDVYDAHECTANVPCYPMPPAVPPVCATGDACKAAPTPQPSLFGPAPSATFSGVGNVSPPSPGGGVRVKSLTRAQKLERALRECRKRSRKQRATCRRAARKRFGPVAGSHKASAKRKGRG